MLNIGNVNQNGSPYRRETWREIERDYPRKVWGFKVDMLADEGQSGKPDNPSFMQRFMSRWVV